DHRDLLDLVGDLLQRFEFLQHIGRHSFVDVRLLREHLLQRALAERLAYRELQRTVQVFADVLYARSRVRYVANLVHGPDVDTHGDLIAGQDLLAGYFDRLAAHFEHLDTRCRDHVPEAVVAGANFADKPPLEVHHGYLHIGSLQP